MEDDLALPNTVYAVKQLSEKFYRFLFSDNEAVATNVGINGTMLVCPDS